MRNSQTTTNIKLVANCGCGYRLENTFLAPSLFLKTASDHSELNGHAMTISGGITPTERKPAFAPKEEYGY